MLRNNQFIYLLSFFFIFSFSALASNQSVPPRGQLHAAYLLKYSVDTSQSISALQELVSKYPDSYELWELKGDLHMMHAGNVNIFRKRGQIRSAISAYENAVKLNPNASQSQAVLLSLYDALPSALGGDDRKAREKRSELRLTSESLYLYAQGLRYLVVGDDYHAKDKFRSAVSVEGASPDIYIGVIRYFIEVDLFEEASIYLDESLDIYGEYQPLRYQHSRFRVLKMEVSDELLYDLYEVINKYDESPGKLIPEYSYLMLARSYQIIGDIDESKKYYNMVFDSAPLLVERSSFDKYYKELSD